MNNFIKGVFKLKNFEQGAKEALDAHRVGLLHQLFSISLGIFIIGSLLGNLFSSHADSKISFNILLAIIVTGLLYLFLLYIKYKVNDIQKKYTMYFTIVVVLMATTLIFNVDQHFVNSISVIFTLFFVIFFLFNLKRLFLFWFLPVVGMLYYWVINPNVAVQLGHGYYISIIFSMVMLSYLGYKGVKLNHWYEDMLMNEVFKVNEQNMELTAYNQEFQATQAELFENYDKITLLNKELESSMKQLDHLAYNDPLTGIFNRNALTKAMDEHLLTNRNILFVMLDLKNLKYINTTFGFEAGDHILQYVATSLPQVLPNITFYGRIGGDEFGLVLPDDSDPKECLQKLNEYYHQFHTDYFSFTLSFYLGVAHAAIGDTSMDLIKNADIALYNAKHNTKDFAYYSPDYMKVSQDHLQISSQLELAIEHEEISLVFQPKIRAKDLSIYGFETLVRWNSPTLGFVAPPVFIGLAEKTGFISPLSFYIIEHTCRFLEKAIQLSEDIKVSINISGIQLLEDNFVTDFMKIIEKHHIPPKNVALEITETSIIEELNQASVVLNNLRDHGYQIYLDDFGTGYSSLNYLRYLPIDYLKIDKSFIDPIAQDDKSLAMVSTIITLAKSYDLQLVAEGVEDGSQFQLLKENGCDLIQGYYFDRPLDEASAMDRLKNPPTYA